MHEIKTFIISLLLFAIIQFIICEKLILPHIHIELLHTTLYRFSLSIIIGVLGYIIIMIFVICTKNKH